MKRLMLFVSIVFIIGSVQAQRIKDTEVPQAIRTKIKTLYPDAAALKWEKENGNYEVGFKNGKEEISVLLDEKGNVKETELAIEVAALPKAISDYVKKNHSAYSISGAAKITDAKKAVTYEAELKKDKEVFDLVFDEKGNFLKKIVE